MIVCRLTLIQICEALLKIFKLIENESEHTQTQHLIKLILLTIA